MVILNGKSQNTFEWKRILYIERNIEWKAGGRVVRLSTANPIVAGLNPGMRK